MRRNFRELYESRMSPRKEIIDTPQLSPSPHHNYGAEIGSVLGLPNDPATLTLLASVNFLTFKNFCQRLFTARKLKVFLS
jgi:hypothetical protein